MTSLYCEHVCRRKSTWNGIRMFLNFNCPKSVCNLLEVKRDRCITYKTERNLRAFVCNSVKYTVSNSQFIIPKLLYFKFCKTSTILSHTCCDK